MHRFSRARILSAAAALALAPLAQAQITGIFSNATGAANNSVPGSGLPFAIGTGSASAFERPFLSPDGNRWMISAIQEDATDDKDIIIVGGGLTGAGATTVATEDSPTPFDNTRLFGLLDANMGINNAGQYVYTADIDGATTDDEVLVLFNGTTTTAAIREGSPSPIAGENFGLTIDAAHILADGTPRYRASLNPTTTKFILGSGTTTAIVDTDVTVPTGQLVAPDQSVDALGAQQFASSSDGTKHIWVGDLNGPTTTDAIVVVNGAVVAQEGAPLPGGIAPAVNVGIISTGDKQAQMSPNGNHWAARMPLSDTTDVVLYNNALAARTDSPIFAGSPLSWDDTAFAATFFMNTVNDNGDIVIGGLVNSGDANRDAVLVYLPAGGPSGIILATEGDPVDLDGNGLFDDDAFIDIFGNDDGALTADGRFYFVASVQNSAGTATGNAFLVMRVPEPGSLAALGLGTMIALRRRR